MEASQGQYGYPPVRSATTVTVSSDQDLEKQRQLDEWDVARKSAPSPFLGPEGRAQPVIALFALILFFLASAAGITFFVLALVGVVISRAAELPSRTVVFAASVVGVVYTVIHLAAARTSYRKKEHGSPQIYGNYKHAMGLLLVRLSVPVWITAVVTAALAVANMEDALMRSFMTDPKQMSYVNLMVAVVGLVANLSLLFCVETSMTPFATSLISKNEFLQRRGKTSSMMFAGYEFEEEKSREPQLPLTVGQPQQQHQHRVLNSHDRVNGSWPVQRSRSNASSIYSTQTQPRVPAVPNGDREYPRPGTAISTDVPAEPLCVRTIPFADGEEARPPVHMSWRPPSHHGKRSIDYTVRPKSGIPPPLPAAVSTTAREPAIPSLPVASEHRSYPSVPGSSSSSRTIWAPSATGHQRQRSGSRETNGRRPVSQHVPMPAAQLLSQVPPIPVPPNQQDTSTTSGPSPPVCRATTTPSPRSKALRSHPPFDAWPNDNGYPSVRPSTAPGLPASTIENWGVPQHSVSVKRKPVGQGRTSFETDGRSAMVDDDYSSSCYEDDDSDVQDDEETGAPAGLARALSRTQRRLLKEKGKELKRSNTANNFSRPLPRSKSLVSMNRRSFSEHSRTTNTAFTFDSGEVRYKE
ncbi:hypothetical protein MCOR02_010018 [Pyricularia oryzae]|uniref:Uncharacterized protein n=1 Tax=Pyricularia oryzae TaxID=318829 RepID=A0A4P7NC43_PYROR|nr:hypothetical protein MCOR02_010018 [Pyricularia oryzae]KAI6256446.1 hypothetical protein MCOR19_007110 [Pyricularia oryzae]KAI6307914.1 hypothetical protein MCOR29_009496 [Pyricularia oryzae]KAI6328361.1 hypothetical protein MCOR34_000167 [Pyricularia oryzae]KAI6376330.1 hypothetical protein MCOR32_005058 [Pyricularia oryzae]